MSPCQRGPSPRLQARADIGELAIALEMFKSKYGVPYVPATFDLRDEYPDPADPHAAYLRKLFPSLIEFPAEEAGPPPRWNWRAGGRAPAPGADLPNVLAGSQCLVFFLGGPDGEGFAAPPLHPAARGRGPGVGPFFDFRPYRLGSAGEYLDPWGTPYAYFTAVAGNDYEYADPDDPAGARPGHPFSGRGPNGPGGPRPCWHGPTEAVNPTTFQIISAGPDRVFGRGGVWRPGAGDYAPGRPGYDDIANFHPGILGEP